MFMGKIRISIVVAIYNVKPYLNKCIESIVNQNYSNIQIILVNDGSTDDSDEICKKYIDDYRVTLINQTNAGLSSARNEGIKYVKGDYFFFVDGDDYIEPDACEKIIRIIDEQRLDMIAFEFCEGANNVPRKSPVCKGTDYYKINARKGILAFNAVLYVYRTEFWKNNLFAFKEGIVHEDLQLIPQVIIKAESILYAGFGYYNYVQRAESITKTIENVEYRKKCIDEIMMEWLETSQSTQDYELKTAMSGMISKCYIYSCSQNNNYQKKDLLFSRTFLVKNSLNVKELVKAVCFSVMPQVYIHLFNLKHFNSF